ncbi:HAD family hydrolase [Prolixibacter denitrificans]|uniref:Haloacid dehalogenase n=1 Tax=Prolixibacter denitrificans TaxID=1541063 RepID=A0A2P8CCD5_9BACT|nr:HAD family hydrolase [Prolixibacter denitrificans]PSK82636.1 putative hydrolase of the HAD superfamily [Prolixibacter denitrificans]GET21540.1 haloacid dehalogenase [Prolixibacter denitrificans]
MKNIKVIAFDGDDTLWVNEPYYQETETQFCNLLTAYLPEEEIRKVLFQTEIENLSLYGYGAKGFTLSMMETALKISENRLEPAVLQEIIRLGKTLLDKPIELLDGVQSVLASLQNRYELVLATKGDLLDQERKLFKSGLNPFFHHIEIMSNKKEDDYEKLLHHLDIEPEEFLMVGNSLPSDIIPVVKLGGFGIHVPYHTTWQHEEVARHNLDTKYYREIEELSEIPELLSHE